MSKTTGRNIGYGRFVRRNATWMDMIAIQNPKSRIRDQGFTLIEVMLALAILGSALFVLLDGHHAALRLFQQAQDEATTRSLMERALAMAEVELLAGNLEGSGDFGKRYPEHTFSFAAEQIGDEELPLYQLAVTVEGPGESHEMTLFVYDTR